MRPQLRPQLLLLYAAVASVCFGQQSFNGIQLKDTGSTQGYLDLFDSTNTHKAHMVAPSSMSADVTVVCPPCTAIPAQSANQVYAGPTTGAAAVPTFRALVAADIPAVTVNLTSGVTGILPVANGGTNAATATANQVFAGPSTGSPAAPAFRSLAAADLPSVSLTAGVTGVLPVANGGTNAATVSANQFFGGPTSGGAVAPAFRGISANDVPATLNGTAFTSATGSDVVTISNSGSGGRGMYINNSVGGSTGTILSGTGSGTNMMVMANGSGTCTLTAVALTCVSDQTLKKNIVPIDTALGSVLALKPVVFNFNNEPDGGALHPGLIAQQTQQVIPLVVSNMPDGQTGAASGKLGINYSEIVPYLIRAIQELEAQIVALQNVVVKPPAQ